MAENEQLKVFVSYSRADSVIADEIVAGLEFADRFDVFIDREAIHEGEAWQARLQSLIETSDAIVFLLSPHSASSEVCHWEVELAASLSKRVIPVLLDSPGETEAPASLSELNYVRLDEGRSFMEGLAGLRRALLTDIEWLREHTRLQQRAVEWNAAGRPEERLLIGEDIINAKTWLQSISPEAPGPTQLHREFIAASEAGAELRLSEERERAEALQKSVKRTRLALLGASLLAIVAAGVGGFAYLQWGAAQSSEQLAINAREAADTARTLAEELAAKQKETAEDLARQIESMKLPRNLIIQVDGSKNDAVYLGGNWFEVLNMYQNSVVLIRGTSEGKGIRFGSGFILDGKLIHKSLESEPILIAPSFLLSSEGHRSGMDVGSAHISFPLLADKNKNQFKVGDAVWESSHDVGISFFYLGDELPTSVVLIDKVVDNKWWQNITDSGEDYFHASRDREYNGYFLEKTLSKLVIGYSDIMGSGHHFVITSIVGSGIYSKQTEEKRGNTGREIFSTDLDQFPIVWTPHWSQPGASGAPLFDPYSKSVICAHVRGGRPQDYYYTIFKYTTGRCTLIFPFIEAAREDLAEEFAAKESEGNAPPPVGTQP